MLFRVFKQVALSFEQDGFIGHTDLAKAGADEVDRFVESRLAVT